MAVKACHNSSKTFLAAESLLWWITHFRDGIVVSTAPSDRQVEKLLWGEVRKAMARKMVLVFHSTSKYQASRIDAARCGLFAQVGLSADVIP